MGDYGQMIETMETGTVDTLGALMLVVVVVDVEVIMSWEVMSGERNQDQRSNRLNRGGDGLALES